MSKYFYTRTNQTLQSEYQCPYLPIFFQWQNSYLTPSVLFSSIAASVVNGLMAIITTASNGLVIISILKRKSFRVNSFMLLLVSLSITDFLIGFLVQPLYVACRVCEIIGRPDLVCTTRTLYKVVGNICGATSLGHVSFISIERYLAVRFPSRYKALLSIRRTLFGITFIWLFFILYVVLAVVGFPEQTAEFPARSILIAVVVLITATCYTRTFFKFGSNNVAAASGHASIATQQRIKKEKRIAWTMLLTVGILALFYFPEMISYPIITKNLEKLSLIWIGLSWTTTIMFANSLVNPFWYCWKFRAIRRDILSLVGCARDVSPERDDNGRAGNTDTFNVGRRNYFSTNGTIPMYSLSRPRPASALDVRCPETMANLPFTSKCSTQDGTFSYTGHSLQVPHNLIGAVSQ